MYVSNREAQAGANFWVCQFAKVSGDVDRSIIAIWFLSWPLTSLKFPTASSFVPSGDASILSTWNAVVDLRDTVTGRLISEDT